MSDRYSSKFTLVNLINFLAKTSGRDKSCRFFQYFSKFAKALILHLAQKKPEDARALFTDLANKVDIIGGQMSNTRKVLRWGREIGILLNLYRLFKAWKEKKSSDSYNKVNNSLFVSTKILADLSLVLFFVFDHILWFGKIGILKNEKIKSKADFLSNLFWLFECVFTIIHDNVEIYLLNKKLQEKNTNSIKSPSDNEDIKILNDRIDQVIIDILRSVIDIPIAISFMNEKFLSPGFVGLLGSITSYIGCYQNW